MLISYPLLDSYIILQLTIIRERARLPDWLAIMYHVPLYHRMDADGWFDGPGILGLDIGIGAPMSNNN